MALLTAAAKAAKAAAAKATAAAAAAKKPSTTPAATPAATPRTRAEQRGAEQARKNAEYDARQKKLRDAANRADMQAFQETGRAFNPPGPGEIRPPSSPGLRRPSQPPLAYTPTNKYTLPPEGLLPTFRSSGSVPQSAISSPAINALSPADQAILRQVEAFAPRPASDLRPGDARSTFAKGPQPARAPFELNPPPSGPSSAVRSTTDTNGFRARNAENVTRALEQGRAPTLRPTGPMAMSPNAAAAEAAALTKAAETIVKKLSPEVARRLAPQLIEIVGAPAIGVLARFGIIGSGLGAALATMWPTSTSNNDTMEGRNAESLLDTEAINPVTGMPFEGRNPDVGEGMPDEATDMAWPPETDGDLPPSATRPEPAPGPAPGPEPAPISLDEQMRAFLERLQSTNSDAAATAPPNNPAPPVSNSLLAAPDNEQMTASMPEPMPTPALEPSSRGPLGQGPAFNGITPTNGALDYLDFGPAFKQFRGMLGPNAVFTWKGKKYTTQQASDRRP